MEKETKDIPLEKLTFHQLKQEHLMKHAKSLGGKKAVEAVKYLIEINKRQPLTEESIAAKREELKAKTKRQKTDIKDEDGEVIGHDYKPTSKKLYTDKAIEKMLKEFKGELVNTPFAQKRLYCEKYWKGKLPKADKPDVPSYDDVLTALLKELEQEQ